MARFSGKIQSVKFVDTAEKTIEVLHGEDSKKVFSYILPLDYTNQDFLDLLEEYSIEEIQDQTRDYFQTIINHKNSEIYHAAKSMFKEWLENAQKDLDKQDEERYKIFEEYKDQQLQTMQKEWHVREILEVGCATLSQHMLYKNMVKKFFLCMLVSHTK